MNISIRNGNVIDELRKILSESVDCIVSSPPYYGLRSYKGADTIWGGDSECEHDWITGGHKYRSGGVDSANTGNDKIGASHIDYYSNTCSKCDAWKGQLGLEPSYEMYIDHLMLVMTELKRILKKTGTLFWNMGDSYSGSGGAGGDYNTGGIREGQPKYKHGKSEIPSKSLMMIPERIALAMIDDGWILRNKLAWVKRNAMPSSVSDRFSNKWEYVFFFSKSQKYYFDLDSIRKPLAESSIKRISQENIPKQSKSDKSADFAETEPVNNIPKIINNTHKKYNSKYQKTDDMSLQYSQRTNVIEEARQKSHIEAENLFPNDIDKQKEYIKHIHDHLGNPNGSNPGDVITSEKKPYAIAEREDEYVEYRNLPPLKEVADFLNKYRKDMGYTIDEIEYRMNSQSPHHWFNAESYPNSDDWKRIKDILNFPDTYNNAMTEVFLKPSEKQNNPNGANPGDVNQDEALYDIFTDSNIQDAFIEYLERERPELLMPSILDIPTLPHSFAHFAVFPETLVDPLIKAGCPSEVCVKCGKPKLPFFVDTGRYYDHGTGEYAEYHTRETKRKIMDATGVSDSSVFNTELIKERVTKWLPSCKCNAGFEPGTVLDPFAGSGTVGVVAKKQGKSAILIEISPEYVQIIKNRLEIEASGINMNVKFVETASISSLEEEE